MESEHHKTFDLIPHRTFFLISYLDLQRYRRSQPPGSSEVKNGSQNGIGTPKKTMI